MHTYIPAMLMFISMYCTHCYYLAMGKHADVDDDDDDDDDDDNDNDYDYDESGFHGGHHFIL